MSLSITTGLDCEREKYFKCCVLIGKEIWNLQGVIYVITCSSINMADIPDKMVHSWFSEFEQQDVHKEM